MRRALATVIPVALIALAACDAITDPIDDGTPVNLTFAPCPGSSGAPSWFAFQNGGGDWTRVTATSAGAFNFTISSGRGAIATYTADNGLFLLYATTAELQSNLPNCAGALRSVSGSVTGYATLDNVALQMGGGDDFISGSQTPPTAFNISAVDPLATDLVAVRYREAAGTSIVFQRIPSSVFIRRGVSGTSTSTVDFGSATEAGAPVPRNVNVTNVAVGEYIELVAQLALSTTLAEVSAYQNSPASLAGSVTAPFYGLSSSRLTSGETQILSIWATKTSGSIEETRFGSTTYTDATDKTFTLGPSLGTISVTGSSRPTASWTIQPDYNSLYDVTFEQGGGSSFRRIRMIATKGYLGSSAASVTLAVPDLGGAAGFQSSWLLVPGSTADWTFRASGADLSSLNYKPSSYLGAQKSGPFTP